MTEERGRGWAAVAGLALVSAASVVPPALLMFVPLGLLFFALPPRAPMLLALGAFIGWLAFGAPPRGELYYFERGWALLLGAWFVVATVVLPGRPFLARGLAAVAATVVTSALLLGIDGAAADLERAVTELVQSQSAQVLEHIATVPRVDEVMRPQMEQTADMMARLFPAMLAIASLAALAIAWWAYARLSQRDGRPLGGVRSFRFSNELVWVLIGGLLLMILPLDGLLTRTGQNIVVFMGALYALRGLGVLLVITGAAWPAALIVGLALVLLMSKLVMAATILVGLSDTWLDLRARREAPTSPGS